MTDGGDLVIYEKFGAVARLTLNRPAALNAVNLEMRDLLWMLLQAVRDDPDVRAVILRGAGDRAFSAGADVKEFGTAPSYIQARRARHERDLWALMVSLEKPLIAAIQGWALGAGCEMSLFCDLRIAADNARFGLPEVTLGYIPSAGGTQTLPRVVPPAIARQMVMTGEPIDATTALRIGLVHRVVPRAELDAQAEQLAAQLAALPPAYVAAVKKAINAAQDLPLPLALDQEAGTVALAGLIAATA